MEKYNEKKMQELFMKSGQSRADFRRGMGNLDDRIAKNYLNGGDLAVSKLVQAARWFGVKVNTFFKDDSMDELPQDDAADGVPVAEPCTDATTLLRAAQKDHEREMAHLQEMMQLRIGYERKLAALERENELLKASLEKNTDSASGDIVPYMMEHNSNDYYSSKVAEEDSL